MYCTVLQFCIWVYNWSKHLLSATVVKAWLTTLKARDLTITSTPAPPLDWLIAVSSGRTSVLCSLEKSIYKGAPPVPYPPPPPRAVSRKCLFYGGVKSDTFPPPLLLLSIKFKLFNILNGHHGGGGILSKQTANNIFLIKQQLMCEICLVRVRSWEITRMIRNCWRFPLIHLIIWYDNYVVRDVFKANVHPFYREKQCLTFTTAENFYNKYINELKLSLLTDKIFTSYKIYFQYASCRKISFPWKWWKIYLMHFGIKFLFIA